MSDQIIMCFKCPKTFDQRIDFHRHVSLQHLDEVCDDWIKCQACQDEDIFVPNPEELELHSQEHHHHQTKKRRTVKEPLTFQCSYCPSSYVKQSSYNNHARLKHPDLVDRDWFECDLCSEKFPTEFNLQGHKNSAAHTKAKPSNSGSTKKKKEVTCTFCSITFQNGCKFYKHANLLHFDIISVEWVECDKCNSFYPNQGVLANHRSSSQCADSNRDFSGYTQCEFCPKSFCRQYIYFKHASTHHLDSICNVWLKCEKCDSYFPTGSSLQMHVFGAHERSGKPSKSKSVLCSFCPSSLNTANQYYRHANKKHVDVIRKEWVSCKLCNLHFPTFEILSYHKASAHRQEDTTSERFQCDYCNEDFCRFSRYIEHAKKKHEKETERDWILCTDCNSRYPNEKSLRNHQIFAHLNKAKKLQEGKKVKAAKGSRQKRCPCCPRMITSSDSYLKHVKTEHPDFVKAKWHPCGICHSYFPSTMAIKLHCRAKHNGSTGTEIKLLYDCKFCDKKFADLENFTTHGNSLHKEEISKYWPSCDHCELFFPSDESMLDHSTKHEEEELAVLPKNCHFCSEEFDSYKSFVKHSIETHIEEVSSEWMICDSCHSYYPSENELKNHVATIHAQIQTARNGEHSFSKHVRNFSDEESSEDSFDMDLFTEVDPLDILNNKTDFVDVATSGQSIVKVELEEDKFQDFEPVITLEEFPETNSDESFRGSPFEENLGSDKMSSDEEKEEEDNSSNLRYKNSNDQKSKSPIRQKKFKNVNKSNGRQVQAADNTNPGVEIKDEPIDRKESNPEIYQCPDCEKSFGKQAYLNKHRRRAHTEHIPEACEICGKFFNKAADLKIHMKRAHVKANMVECDACGKQFLHKCNLDAHVKSVHAKLKHACHLCEKTFSTSTYLKNHVDSVHL